MRDLLIVVIYLTTVITAIIIGFCLLVKPRLYLVFMGRFTQAQNSSEAALNWDAANERRWRLTGLIALLGGLFMLLAPVLSKPPTGENSHPNPPPQFHGHSTSRWGATAVFFLFLMLGGALILRPLETLDLLWPHRLRTQSGSPRSLIILRIFGCVMILIALAGVLSGAGGH